MRNTTMNTTDYFLSLIETDKRSKSGWYNIVCPCCGCDSNKRSGSFLATDTGGFRYKCHAHSCPYSTATGWEPYSPVSQRVFDLYELLGGDTTDLVDPPFYEDMVATIGFAAGGSDAEGGCFAAGAAV
jgi:hypothetical protein